MSKKWKVTAIVLIIIGLAGLAFNKFDLGDKQNISLKKEWTFDANTLKNMTIAGNSENLEVIFVKSSNESGSIVLEGEFNQMLIDKIENTAISGDHFELDLTTRFELQFFSLNFKTTKDRITVALPNDDILDHLEVSSLSGNTKVEHVLAKNASFSTLSGNLNVLDVTSENLILKTSSGNIVAAEISSKLHASAGSGNIKITNIAGELTAETKSGNITITQKEIGNADVKTTSGNATFTTAKDFNGFYDLRSNSGNIKSPESLGTSAEIIKIRTTSGNIRVLN